MDLLFYGLRIFLTLVKKSPLVSIQHTAKGIFQPLVEEDNYKIYFVSSSFFKQSEILPGDLGLAMMNSL
jgi:hypothetical protein